MSDTFNSDAEPGKIIVLVDGLLRSDQTLIVTATSGWFLVLKADLNGKKFDLSIFDSRMIYKILHDFSTLKHQHIQLKGEYNTNAYTKNKIGYPSHDAVKVLSIKHPASSGKIYESNALPQSRLMYDYMVAKNIYENWADSAIRATKISHTDFYKKYCKLHEDVGM